MSRFRPPDVSTTRISIVFFAEDLSFLGYWPDSLLFSDFTYHATISRATE